MSAGAIIARLGLDTKDFRSGLLNAANQADAGAKRIASSLVGGAKASDLLADSLSGAGQALKLGLGGTAVAAVGGVLIKTLADVREESRRLHEEIIALTTDLGSADYRTLDSMQGRLQEIGKQLESITRKGAGGVGMLRSLQEYFGSAVLMGGSGDYNDVLKRRAEEVSRLQSAQRSETGAVAAKIDTGAQIAEKGNSGNDFEAERMRVGAAHKEKMGSAFEQYNKPGTGAELGKVLDALERQRQADMEAIDRKQSAQERALELERKLLAVKEEGRDVEAQTAEVRLSAAKAERDRVSGSEKQASAEILVQKAEQDLAIAQKKSDELRAQLALEKEIAETKASPEEKQRMRLEGEAGLIEARRKDTRTKPDEQRQLEIDAAKKQADQRGAERASREAGYQTGDSRIDAETGTGAAAKIEALRQKLTLAAQKAKEFAADSERSQSEIAGAHAAVTALRNQLEEAARAQEDAAEAASEGTKILLAQTRGQETLAGKLQAEERYRKAINQALRDGNTVLAAQLTAQQKLSVGQESFKDWKKTPEQRRQERQGERDTARDQRAYEREVADVKNAMDRGVTGMTGRRGRIAEDIEKGHINPNDPLGAKSLSKTSPAGKFNGSMQSLTQGQEGKAMISKLDELKAVLEKIEKKEFGNL